MEIKISTLEKYLYERYSSWTNEQGLFLKLVEEIGEVAEVLNKRAGRKASDENDLQEQLGIAGLVMAVDVATANNTVGIIMTGAIAKAEQLQKDIITPLRRHRDDMTYAREKWLAYKPAYDRTVESDE